MYTGLIAGKDRHLTVIILLGQVLTNVIKSNIYTSLDKCRDLTVIILYYINRLDDNILFSGDKYPILIYFQQGFKVVGWKTRSAECGVRSVENAEYGKCGVWRMRSMENAECGKCGVWKMWSVENAEYGKCGVWKMRSMENAECGKCGVWKMRSVWKCINVDRFIHFKAF